MTDNIIVDTATRIFADLCGPLTWVPDTLGGAGAEMVDGFAVLRVAGRFAAPVPLAETLLAGWLLAQAKIEAPAGPMTIAPVYEDGHIELAELALSGRARHIPFARNARHIVVLAYEAGTPSVALVAADGLAISQGTSLAGEPRVTVSFDGATALAAGPAPALDTLGLVQLGAAARAQQMAGALEHILEQSVQFSLDRVQFGRPIAKFQAVQHNLASLAGEVAAAEAIASHGLGSALVAAEVAIAKLRVGEAAGTGAGIAHQVHGAMGFTYEHSLHHATRRLWAWREEFGNEAVWAARLGRMVAARGADELWPFITQA